MFRYRMNTRPARFGWVMLLVIIGLLLIILAGQLRSPPPTASAPPASTENGVNIAGSALEDLWGDIRYGAARLWERLTGQDRVEPVDISLDGLGVGDTPVSSGSGDEEEVIVGGDITVEIANPIEPEAFVPVGSSPQILIYHTHSYEAYVKQEGQNYEETTKWRTKSNDFNIARVGEELARTLSSKYGIAVLHDVTDHEYPKLGTSYTRSLKTMQKDMAANKDLKILIDLHRDAYNAGINPSTVTINGKKVARVMLVIGTGQGQTGVGFSEKPDWRKNLLLATAITDRLNDFDPQLARKVDIKTGRYNQHLSTGAILIEIGHNENTLDEALAAVPFVAQAVAEVYNTMMESGKLAPAAATTSPASTAPTGGSAVPATGSMATASPQSTATHATQSLVTPSPAGTEPRVITIEPPETARPPT